MQTDQKVYKIDKSVETTTEERLQPSLALCLEKILRRFYNVDLNDDLPAHCYSPATGLDYERLTPYIETLIIDHSLSTLSDFETLHLDLLNQLYISNTLSTSPSVVESIFRIMQDEKVYGEILEYMILFEQQFLSQGPRFLRYTAEMLCEVYQSNTFEQLNNWSAKDFRVRLLIPRIKLITEA